MYIFYIKFDPPYLYYALFIQLLWVMLVTCISGCHVIQMLIMAFMGLLLFLIKNMRIILNYFDSCGHLFYFCCPLIFTASHIHQLVFMRPYFCQLLPYDDMDDQGNLDFQVKPFYTLGINKRESACL